MTYCKSPQKFIAIQYFIMYIEFHTYKNYLAMPRQKYNNQDKYQPKGILNFIQCKGNQAPNPPNPKINEKLSSRLLQGF